MVSIDCVSTGAKLKQLARERGMSNSDIQRLMGFNTPQSVYKWFRGDSMPTIDNLVILADAFDCTIDDLLVIQR